MATKKIIALLITAALCTASLLACAKEDAGNQSTTAAEGDAAATTVSEDEDVFEERIPDDLPAADYGGYEFRVVTKSEEHNVHWMARDIYAETENGEPINDAVYYRNKAIEERFNVKIVEKREKDPYSYANKMIKSGIDDFDVFSGGLQDSTEKLAQEGMLEDLRQMPGVNLSKPWWDQKAEEQMSIDNKLYMTTSDLVIMDEDATWVIMFNKKLIKDLSLDDPYALVNEGKWTMDKMLEMMKASAKDLNGDGNMNYEDQYGLVSQWSNARYFFNGANEKAARKDGSDMPVITLYSDRSVNVVEKIIALQSDKSITINADDWTKDFPNDTVWDKMQLVIFNTDRSLFYYAGMNRVTLLRTMDTDFGILPPPKYDEQQEGYHVALSVWCSSCVSVPVTIEDKTRTGTILEALTAESRYTVVPAYYEISLKGKFARDNESRDMLDLIFANRSYDIGEMYNWGALNEITNNFSKSVQNTFTSDVEKNKSKIEAAMNKTIDKFISLG